MLAEFRQLDASVYAQSVDRENPPFMVAAMFTADLRPFADRLKWSLEQLGLAFSLYEVPTIHSSISASGTSNIAFCKPNFIHFVLKRFGLPVLYVDADVVFRETPQKVFQLAQEQIDFAIYNWLADNACDAYEPADFPVNGTAAKGRFYRFSHSIDLYDPTQLMGSGGAQYYTPNAELFLRGWLDTISRFPRIGDDSLLDYTYNFWTQKNTIRTFWWTKDYCRIAFWIHVKPIIDHPQFTSRSMPSFYSLFHTPRFKLASVESRVSQGPFPRDCIIDTAEKSLLRLDSAGKAIVVGHFDTELWLSAEA